MARRLLRLQLAGAALLALGIAGVLARDVVRSPDVPFLWQDGTPWIVAQTPIQTHGMQIELAHPPRSFFERRFVAHEGGNPKTLRVRALRDVSLFLNGKELPLAGRDRDRWKEATIVDVTSYVVPGENVLFARVDNAAGNPVLQLRLDGLDEPLQSDERWLAAWEGDPIDHAARADDVLRHPESLDLPSPPSSLAAKALPLSIVAVGGGALFLLLLRRPAAARWAPAVALACVTVLWSALFARIVKMPAGVGFDSLAHLAYIRWILEHRALPLASDGTAMYHPPLFHALSAILLGVVGPHGFPERVILALVPLLSGFGMVFVARGMARCLMPGSPWLEAGAIVAAGFLPMSLTLAASLSNEAPHALLASLALLAAVRALVRERATYRDDGTLGVLLGAAVLTKYSSLLLVPVLLGALATKRLMVERSGPTRALSGGAASAALVLVLGGWYYLRNQLLFSDPLVWNLNATPGQTWWQLPGFHTSAYFLQFGDALTRPWFSSFHSFWDSLYTTLWGDGLLSGAVAPSQAGDRWRYDWMAAAFLLALPAQLLLAIGWGRASVLAFRGSDLGRRLAFSVVVLLPILLLASLLIGCLHYPFWSGGKAFYALLLTPTLALLGALGFGALDGLLAGRAPLAIRALPYCWLASFLCAVGWAYAG